MIGPTGVGKTEISRRLAKLGRRAVHQDRGDEVHRGRLRRPRCREHRSRSSSKSASAGPRARRGSRARRAEAAAEERVLDALVGEERQPATRESFRRKLRENELDDKEIEVDVSDGGGGLPMFEIPGQPGASMGMMNINDMLGKAMGGRTKKRRSRLPTAMRC